MPVRRPCHGSMRTNSHLMLTLNHLRVGCQQKTGISTANPANTAINAMGADWLQPTGDPFGGAPHPQESCPRSFGGHPFAVLLERGGRNYEKIMVQSPWSPPSGGNKEHAQHFGLSVGEVVHAVWSSAIEIKAISLVQDEFVVAVIERRRTGKHQQKFFAVMWQQL